MSIHAAMTLVAEAALAAASVRALGTNPPPFPVDLAVADAAMVAVVATVGSVAPPAVVALV